MGVCAVAYVLAALILIPGLVGLLMGDHRTTARAAWQVALALALLTAAAARC